MAVHGINFIPWLKLYCRPKFGKPSKSIREVIITSVL